MRERHASFWLRGCDHRTVLVSRESVAPRLIVKPHASDCIFFFLTTFREDSVIFIYPETVAMGFFSKSPRQLPSESVNCMN